MAEPSEIYALQAKEEIYGAVMNAIIEQRPELKEILRATGGELSVPAGTRDSHPAPDP